MACCSQRKIYSQANPLILGTDEGGDATEVVVSVNIRGVRPGTKTWARGSHFQVLLDKGWIKLA